ncbi:hypothetical protein pb186bvf_009328 [Paramecium bursaria]
MFAAEVRYDQVDKLEKNIYSYVSHLISQSQIKENKQIVKWDLQRMQLVLNQILYQIQLNNTLKNDEGFKQQSCYSETSNNNWFIE